MKDFFKFIGQQGVLGLAIGFVLGGSVTKLVEALVTDIINPILSIFLGRVDALAEASLKIGNVVIAWGHFVTVFIDFLVIALVIYFAVKWLKISIKK
jgi:large conductance mechanosensitive channel